VLAAVKQGLDVFRRMPDQFEVVDEDEKESEG
jgi:hypothetical protein